MDQYILRIENVEIPALRERLEPLESGRQHLGTRESGGAWQDITQREIETIKGALKVYEAILAEYQLHKG